MIHNWVDTFCNVHRNVHHPRNTNFMTKQCHAHRIHRKDAVGGQLAVRLHPASWLSRLQWEQNQSAFSSLFINQN